MGIFLCNLSTNANFMSCKIEDCVIGKCITRYDYRPFMENEKVVIITGGAKGIGAEIGRLLLSKSYRVVISDIDLKSKEAFLEDSSRLLFVKVDVKNEASVKKMVQTTMKHFGRIDALINNAGILPEFNTPIEKMKLTQWHQFIDTNLTGAFLCIKHCISQLHKNRGSIVNMASTRALQSEGYDYPYSASKGGLVSLTHALSVDLGPQVRVNCISPGWINSHHEELKKKDHQQHPVGRVGKPEDIAQMVAFLISHESSFITGQNFIVDGGMTIKMIYD